MKTSEKTPDLSLAGVPEDALIAQETGQGKLIAEALGKSAEGLETVEYVTVKTPLPKLFGSLDPNKTITEALFKFSRDKDGILPKSSRKATTGVLRHPFDMELALQMRTVNPYHGACLSAISDFICGSGFENEAANNALGEVCEHGHIHFLTRLVGQYLATGNSPVEIVRPEGGQIHKLLPMASPKVSKVLPTDDPDVHYWVWQPGTHYQSWGVNRGYRELDGTGNAAFAPAGKRQEILDLMKSGNFAGYKIGMSVHEDRLGEAAMLVAPTDQWDHYGCPQWIGAHPYLELSRIHMQRAHDYFFNRGTPDTVTFIYGMQVNKKERARIQESLNVGVGPGFGRSTVVFMPNASSKTGKVQVEKFGDSVDGDSFSKLHDVYALGTCSAHGVSPDLAGIKVAKSLGGANELLQAIVLLQMTRIDREQEIIRHWLYKNVQPFLKGAPKKDPNFFKFKKKVAVEDSDLAAMNSVARQRESSLGASDPDRGGLERG